MLQERFLEDAVAILTYGFLVIFKALILKHLGICPLNNGSIEELVKIIELWINLLASFVFMEGRHESILLITSWCKDCASNC